MKKRFFLHRRTITIISLTILLIVIICGACKPDSQENITWDPYVPVAGADSTQLTMPSYINPGSEGQMVEVSFDYKSGDSSFALSGAYAVDKKITLMKAKNSTVRMQNVFCDDTVAKYQFKVKIDGKNETQDINAFFIGLRLQDKTSYVDSDTGIWIALRQEQIGMRADNWPGVKYMDCGVDFTKEQTLYIEDDMINDVITISAGTQKKLLATVKIEESSVCMYAPDSDTAKIVGSAQSILPEGYFCLALNNMQTGGASVSNVKVNGYEKTVSEDAVINMLNSKDVYADTWVATDDENRFSGTGNGVVSDKKVGIFYFLWHDNDNNSGDGNIYDHSATYYKNGISGLIDVLGKGPLGFAHYWAEPYFGYYSSDDEWVIRKHTYQLVAAGIDFIFIDVTNGRVHEDNYELILKVWSQMRAEGCKTPQIMFHCGYVRENGLKSFKALWNKLYSKERYKDLWFMHEGKPLIFLPAPVYNLDISAEQQDFFTVRYSWANSKSSWYSDLDGKNCWPWADFYPQAPGKSMSGEIEQMVVMSGYWANSSNGVNRGRSWQNGKQPTSGTQGDFGFGLVDNGTSGKGLAFQEQFSYAIEQDPQILMLVGWNEWWAGRWEAGAAIGQKIADTYYVTDDDNWTRNYYVDAFNPEFSRDIEPVKGLYNDNYYYQMAMNIKEYKGARQIITAFGQRPIIMTDPESQWDIVGPEYRDYKGDITHRDEMSYVGRIRYTNTSGRNDIITAKVSMNKDNLVFYVKCANSITSPEGTNWMNLFIDSDCNATTGWYGYDFVINRTRDGETCSVMRFEKNSWEMTEVGRAKYTVSGDYIQIKIDPALVKIKNEFNFKWADNSVDDGDIMKFIDMGDCAPNDRFSYRYTTKKTAANEPSILTEDMVVLKSGSYYAYAGGKLVRLDESSTKATFFGNVNLFYVPKKFAKDVMSLDVSSLEVYNHYGIEYVEISSVLEKAGKVITRSETMLVLANNSISEADLLVLYRSLY